MSYSCHPEDTIGNEAVIRKTYKRLKDLLDPDPIIDCDTEETIFTFRDKRDIKEQKNTTDKNELILTKVRRQGANGYNNFKQLLTSTKQGELVEFLIRTENGQDTTEIEKELYKMAEQRLTSRPNYFQRKNGSYIFNPRAFEKNPRPGYCCVFGSRPRLRFNIPSNTNGSPYVSVYTFLSSANKI